MIFANTFKTVLVIVLVIVNMHNAHKKKTKRKRDLFSCILMVRTLQITKLQLANKTHTTVSSELKSL